MKAYPDTGHLTQQQEELFLWKQVEMPKRLDALDSILPEFHSLALVGLTKHMSHLPLSQYLTHMGYITLL